MFIRFGSKLYTQIVDIPMGTIVLFLCICVFLFCSERDLMLYRSDNNQVDFIVAFESNSIYRDDLLNTRGIWKVLSTASYLHNAFIKCYQILHFRKLEFNGYLMVYFLSKKDPACTCSACSK